MAALYRDELRALRSVQVDADCLTIKFKGPRLFFAAFFATVFEALRAFFTTRLLLAARFFAAAFLLAPAGDLAAFFALRFFEAFLAAVATMNSF